MTCMLFGNHRILVLGFVAGHRDIWDLDRRMQRPGRYERQGTLPREKRGLEARDRDGLQPEPKRSKVPALAR